VLVCACARAFVSLTCCAQTEADRAKEKGALRSSDVADPTANEVSKPAVAPGTLSPKDDEANSHIQRTEAKAAQSEVLIEVCARACLTVCVCFAVSSGNRG